MNEFKVIIAGGRTFNDYELMKRECDKILAPLKVKVVVISGTAGGADTLGERYAKERGYGIHRFPANWDRYGKSAGYKRNTQMAEVADALIAFWDGESRGTKHMIDIATGKNLQVWKVMYNRQAKLIIRTSTVYGYKGKDKLDVSIKSGDKAFAPSWDIVNGVKDKTITQEKYIEVYKEIIEESMRVNPGRWREVINSGSVTLCCYCKPGEFCHRIYLARVLVHVATSLGILAKYEGEV